MNVDYKLMKVNLWKNIVLNLVYGKLNTKFENFGIIN
jgi:hypothetical protein